jgi:hypothetical protein
MVGDLAPFARKTLDSRIRGNDDSPGVVPAKVGFAGVVPANAGIQRRLQRKAAEAPRGNDA